MVVDEQGRVSLWYLAACVLMVTAGCSVRNTPRRSAGSSVPHSSSSSQPRPSALFAWPVSAGTISSGFGIRNGVMHDGVDISAAYGTPVRAAADGRVIYAGRLRGYGNVVIVRHDSHYVTVYGHNSSNEVREGQNVVRAQEIAKVGSTGRTTGPNLHFEVRCDNIAHNPLTYLPAPRTATAFARSGGS